MNPIDFEPKYVQGDIILFLRKLAKKYQPHLRNVHWELHVLSMENTLLMDFDPDNLEKILVSIFSNAMKYTPSGSDLYLQLSHRNEAGHPLFNMVIEDKGAGIPEAELAQLFEHNQQAYNNSISDSIFDNSVSMSVAANWIRKFNGEIKVANKIGKGTYYSIKLPITNHAAMKTDWSHLKPTIIPAAAPAIKQEKVIEKLTPKTPPIVPKPASGLPSLLVVEDNEDMQEYLTMCLEDNYQITVANDGEEGVKIAREQLPDLILSDIMMPIKDGYELCRDLKADKRTNHIPILLITAKTDLESKIQGIESGASDYMLKPFNPKELLSRLQQLAE